MKAAAALLAAIAAGSAFAQSAKPEASYPNRPIRLIVPVPPGGSSDFVARIGGDGKLVALEQRLTEDNVKRMQAGTSTREDMRELFGPPTTVSDYPRQERQVWGYRMFAFDTSRGTVLYAQFSPDGVLREMFRIYEEDENPNMGSGGATN